MSHRLIDILMITYNRPAYTALSLRRLFETCGDDCRVWLWHNGDHDETLSVVKSLLDEYDAHEFHHSVENQGLRGPTNWFFEHSSGDYLMKVDDDCLMPSGWSETLCTAHGDNERFGVIGCWRFTDEEFEPELAHRKIRLFNGGHRLMLNCWIEGSGFLMKRECVADQGLLARGQSFPQYCVRLAARGWVNGWYYPFLYQEHMDHPWSRHTMLKSDEDLMRHLPLVAKRRGIATVAELRDFFRDEARYLQAAEPDARLYLGWRRRIRRLGDRVRRVPQAGPARLRGRPAAETRPSVGRSERRVLPGLRRRLQIGLKLYHRSAWVNAPYRSTRPMVIVGGCERSGTTLLRAGLDCHPMITAGPESWLFVFKPDPVFLAAEYRMDRRWLQTLLDESNGLAEFIDRFSDAVCRCHDKPIWGEKSPHNVFRLQYIWDHFPNARFIHVIRDGRDVVCSLRHHPRHRRVGDRYVPTNIDNPISSCADKWVKAVTAGLEHRDDERYMEVRYEDLVGCYEATMRRICRHCHVEWSEQLLDREHIQSRKTDLEIVDPQVRQSLSPSSIGRWRRELAPDQIAVVMRRAGVLLARLGYTDQDDGRA